MASLIQRSSNYTDNHISVRNENIKRKLGKEAESLLIREESDLMLSNIFADLSLVHLPLEILENN